MERIYYRRIKVCRYAKVVGVESTTCTCWFDMWQSYVLHVDTETKYKRDLPSARNTVWLTLGMVYMLITPTDNIPVFPHISQWHAHCMTTFRCPHISVTYSPIAFHIWPPMSVWIIWKWHFSEIVGAWKLPVEKCETDIRPQLAPSGLWNRERGWAVCWASDECLRMGLLGALPPWVPAKTSWTLAPCAQPCSIIRAAIWRSSLNSSGQHQAKEARGESRA